MPARKMRVDLFDNEGNRYSISFEGEVTRDKALRLLDLVELLGGVPASGTDPHTNVAPPVPQLSKYDKLNSAVQRHFPVAWFSSKEVQSIYEQEFKEPIGLSTVATYLGRMAIKGFVLRMGPSNSLKYKVAPRIPQATIEQRLI